jgi:DNA-binding MarR family transcriptional regulator
MTVSGNRTRPSSDVDPTEQSGWRPLHELLRNMDADIARIYSDREVAGLTPRHVRPLIKLSRLGPMTVRELAAALGVTHSAASQTAATLVKAGYARTKTGTDARTRSIALTARGRGLVPLLEAEWRATESAIAELEAEIPYSLTQVVSDLEAALGRRSFHDRISEHIADEL